MDDKIKEAIKLLRENGYIVRKLSKTQQEDADECETLDGDKECFGCSCSVCIMQ